MTVFLLPDDIVFPSPTLAEPDGLLAVGGDLRCERLVLAYRMGIFPWYAQGDPILWWSPDPRLVLLPGDLHISRRFSRVLKTHGFRVTFDAAFGAVMRGCAAPRRRPDEGTWILPEMIAAYKNLHEQGVAHSVEVWREDALVGGLYGLALGAAFFGESMFSRVSNASKVALAALVRRLECCGFDFVDCQTTTGHLMRMGAREVSRRSFLAMLEKALAKPVRFGGLPAGEMESAAALRERWPGALLHSCGA